MRRTGSTAKEFADMQLGRLGQSSKVNPRATSLPMAPAATTLRRVIDLHLPTRSSPAIVRLKRESGEIAEWINSSRVHVGIEPGPGFRSWFTRAHALQLKPVHTKAMNMLSPFGRHTFYGVDIKE
jgi:hypothetical protein